MNPTTEKAIKVPMEVKYVPAWLTWVGCVTSCLNALEVKCDVHDVAGMSGYAFMLSVHEQLCPSGPTVFEWGTMLPGISALGRTSLVMQTCQCHNKDHATDLTREHCKQAFDLVAREIEAGRPCVIWGTYLPEFGVVYGVEDDKYLVKSFKECINEEQPPIKYDEIDAPGGVYALGFPSPTKYKKANAWDRHAVAGGVQKLRLPSRRPKYGSGLEAYDTWINAFEKDIAHPFGNAYNAQCYNEGRWYAENFLKRIEERNPVAAEPINKAVGFYEKAHEATKELAKIFTFPPGEQLKDEKNRIEGVKLLRDARDAETKAVEAMEESLKLDWNATDC